ncbi:hypothetical protein FOFC_18547 [Fusarium oxysporum]|nr:hypothetical protein FOFC_18547 [Fusarium oxysporum]
MFDLGEISGPDTEPNAPGAVKRVHEIFSLPTFMKNVDGGDVKQGKLSNCWFVAGLTALANLEYGLTQACAAHDIALLCVPAQDEKTNGETTPVNGSDTGKENIKDTEYSSNSSQDDGRAEGWDLDDILDPAGQDVTRDMGFK